MGHDDVPADFQHARDVTRELLDHLVLVGDRLAPRLANERVPANRHDRKSAACHAIASRCRVDYAVNCSPSAVIARVKQASGARVTPAPIWPMPASRCAIPVLMMGRMPVSTTWRTSMQAGVP